MNFRHTPRSPKRAHMPLQEDNQSSYPNIKEVMKENLKLKKYVNCLLEMNEYLKNQLMERNQYQKFKPSGNTFEVELMKI